MPGWTSWRDPVLKYGSPSVTTCRSAFPDSPAVASATLSAIGTHRSPPPTAIPCGRCPTWTVVTSSVAVSIRDRLAPLLLTTNRFLPSSVSW